MHQRKEGKRPHAYRAWEVISMKIPRHLLPEVNALIDRDVAIRLTKQAEELTARAEEATNNPTGETYDFPR
jgi:hypothetical protein